MRGAAFLVGLWCVAASAQVAPPPHKQWKFSRERVTFDTRFPCSRLNECTAVAPNEFRVVVRPENKPINNSPWFAFKVSSAARRHIVVHLRCEDGSWRYRPKISTDGVRWVSMPAEAFEKGDKETETTLRLEVGPEPIWVAAQELVSVESMEAWMRTLERLPYVTQRAIGESRQGHPLYRLDIGDEKVSRHITIIGRQHPPETTGSLALMRFVETVAGDSDLARSFREQFHVMLVPLVNPDGVDRGHWRHSTGGIDLNRDWENFTQPETRLVRDQILGLRDTGRVFLHLDFHSTFHDVFYTQRDEEPTSPQSFTAPWIESIQKRFPDYKVNRSASPTPTPNTSVYWAHHALGIPAITYELGDETDRALLAQIAAGAAEEMMKLLLTLKDAP